MSTTSAEQHSNGGTQQPNAPSADLLGRPGQGGLPLWLNPAIFTSEGFDSDACVADLRRFVPLSTLQTELQNYLATLKSKMVEVINEDYSDYVSLSSRLTSVDGAVLRMRKPLLELKDKLCVVQESVKGELSSLAAGLKRRKEVATARSLLELLQELAHVAGKVEKLLAEVAALDTAAAAGGPPADLDTRSRLLERVAGEVSRLMYQANRGKDLAFVRAMEPRVSSARTQLSTHLTAALEGALTSKAHSAALHCLHAYAELGETATAEAAFRKLVVAPLVAQVISEHKPPAVHIKASASAAAPAGRDEGLASLFSRLLQRIMQDAKDIIDASLTPQSPLRSFDFLGNAVLAEVNEALAEKLPGAFSPGVPRAFHANYLAAQSFLDTLEAKCHGRTSLERLRSSPAYASFLRRWNTSVYFSLLYQEIAGGVEDALGVQRPDLSASPQGPGHMVLPASVAVVDALNRIASRDVYLHVLADKFLRLALQLGARYSTWVAALVAARKEAAAAAAAAGGGMPGGQGGLPHTSSAQHLQGGQQAPGTSAPGSAPAAPGGQGAGQSPAGQSQSNAAVAWAATVPAEDLAVVFGDARSLAERLRSHFAPEFTMLMRTSAHPSPMPITGAANAAVNGGPGPAAAGHGSHGAAAGAAVPAEVAAQAAALEGAVAAATKAVEEVAEALQLQAQAVLAAMSDEVVEACVAVVKQLKGITATYRMTTKGPPTRHSHYVTSSLAPLRTFLDAPRMARLQGDVRTHVASGVIGMVCARYQALAEELLTTVRKTESSLKRLKKAQAQAEDGAGAMSDSDKIALQLHLDVAEFGQQITKFGLTPSALPAYVKLQEVVAVPSATAAATAAAPAAGQPSAGGAAAGGPSQ